MNIERLWKLLLLSPDVKNMKYVHFGKYQFSSVQSLSRGWLFETPSTAAHQASLSITNSRSPPKLMSIKSKMPSNHLILCHLLLLLPSIFPSIGVFSSESVLIGLTSLQSKGLSRIFSNTIVQKHQFFCAQLSL